MTVMPREKTYVPFETLSKIKGTQQLSEKELRKV
jgi:hypothetical protein